MIDRSTYFIQLACILGTGLVAGTFFAFSTFIMAALGRQPPVQGMAAMQSINVTVINPLFMAVLFGTALFSIYLGYVGFRSGAHPAAIVGTALYVFGVIGVTMALNVPLNNELAGLDPAAAASALVWGRYLSDWTYWNSVRCLASVAACAAFAVSL
jgi:uncharacterized membrane protein